MIWLVGNRGMLGSEVERLLQEKSVAYVASDRSVDISRRSEIDGFLRRPEVRRLQWIVNCAAYTAVDQAELDAAAAFAVNADGPRNLAEKAREAGAALLHVSTDYVFSGRPEGEYREDEAPRPLSVYGRSKLQGELDVRRVLDCHVILRTAWLYGRNGANFVDTMLRRFRERPVVPVVRDQRGNPTCARDLARVIVSMVRRLTLRFGVYHFANTGAASRFELAQAVYAESLAAGRAKEGISLLPVASEELSAQARRPSNSSLCTEKIRRTFGFHIRGWREALRDYLYEGRVSE